MSRETEPLTPEERALAQRLARLGAQAEPSPSLDARILAAAHAAAAPPASRTRRPRWPALLGYAATAAIACGIAWQLRPVPNRPVASSAADAAAYEEPLAEVAAPPPMQARTIPPRPLNMPEPPPAEPPSRPQRRSDIRRASAADAADKPRAFEPVFEIDEAVPAHPGADVAAASANAATAPAAAPPPPPAAAAPAAPSAIARQREEGVAAKAQANDAAAERARNSAFDAISAPEEPQSAEADEEVVPPATADSPAVREAWFARIRELLRAGKPDEARASLREFRHRYPRQPLPDDLRALDTE